MSNALRLGSFMVAARVERGEPEQVYVLASDYAELAARLAEAERDRDSAIMAFKLATSIPTMSDDQLRELHANLQEVIDRAAVSASVEQEQK